MFDVRCGVGVTCLALTLALLPDLLSSSVNPPSGAESSTARSMEATPVFQAAGAQIFSGKFVARGRVSRGTCRWDETWTFSAVSFDLGRKRASFTGRLVNAPLVAGCNSGNYPFSNLVIPLTVNGSAVRGNVPSWGDFRVSVTATITGSALDGTFVAVPRSPWSGSASGKFNLQSSLGILLSRESLTLISATGRPQGGRFSYSARRMSGSNAVTIAAGVEPTANPNRAELKNPSNPNPNGAPVQGGLAEITATYTKEGQATKKLTVATFGLSCYNNALEDEWGTPPANCRSVRINGITYSGSITDPHGFEGVFCDSFIAQVRLQGSGLMRDGRKIQYEPTNRSLREVQEYHGADGTPVIAGRTVARDRSIIPRNVLVDISGVGNSLVANDTGGAIKGYRIDLFKGPGEDVCLNFVNNIAIVACQPGNAKCPAKKIPE